MSGENVPAFLKPLIDWRSRYFERLVGAGNLALGPIPAGTPVGVLANINLAPDAPMPETTRRRATLLAALAQLQKGADSAALVDVLRVLSANSACPDVVVNRGHYFGTSLFKEEPGLDDFDKRALIELMKTF